MGIVNLATGLPFESSWPRVRSHHASPYITLGESKPYGEAASPQTFGRSRGLVLGARGIAFGAKSGWTNPYVTDGLVAMWDGEWNVVGGTHDATATSWVDIVSGNVMAADTALQWGDTYSAINDAGSIPHCQCPESVLTAMSSGTWTLEYVVDFAWTRNLHIFEIARGGTSMGGDTIGSYLYLSYLSSTISVSSGNYKRPIAISRASDATLGTGVCYKNGNLISTVGSKKNSTIEEWRIAIGGHTLNDNTATSFVVAGKAYSLRVYNTALTADQITANYYVDKARFGLT